MSCDREEAERERQVKRINRENKREKKADPNLNNDGGTFHVGKNRGRREREERVFPFYWDEENERQTQKAKPKDRRRGCPVGGWEMSLFRSSLREDVERHRSLSPSARPSQAHEEKK